MKRNYKDILENSMKAFDNSNDSNQTTQTTQTDKVKLILDIYDRFTRDTESVDSYAIYLAYLYPFILRDAVIDVFKDNKKGRGFAEFVERTFPKSHGIWKHIKFYKD